MCVCVCVRAHARAQELFGDRESDIRYTKEMVGFYELESEYKENLL